jgi:thioredoxin-related protein
MENRICLVLISLLCIELESHSQILLTGYTEQNGIRFEKDLNWEQVKAKAKSENKYIFMDVFTTWCGPCKMMERNVYINDTVGKYANERFISLKVQMDTSENDNEEIKKWYTFAHQVSKKYQIIAYPSFLFFDPNGRLVYSSIGYKSVPEFLRLLNQSLDSKNLALYQQLEDYKSGKRNYGSMLQLVNYTTSIDRNLAKQIMEDYIDHVDRKELLSKERILMVLDVAKNRRLADSLALLYKLSYLDVLNQAGLLTFENVRFMTRFSSLINSKDKLFFLCYNKPEVVDSTVRFKGWAKNIVNVTITREEMEDRLMKSGQPIPNKPEWNEIKTSIQKKYPELNADLLVMTYQLKYYKILKNWQEYTTLLIQRVRKYGAFGPIEDVDFNLNNLAWDIFKHSNNKEQLTQALIWSDSAVNIVENSTNKQNLANWMDTKANILYKLGRVQDAITLENKVIALNSKDEGFQLNLKKMKSGRPTWD